MRREIAAIGARVVFSLYLFSYLLKDINDDWHFLCYNVLSIALCVQEKDALQSQVTEEETRIMVRRIGSIGVFAVMLLALLLTAGSTGRVYAQSSPGCDITGTVNGSATPTYGTVGTTILFRPTGFRQGEQVSFYFTLPDGRVAGTAAPVNLGVNSDGSIGPLPFTIDQPTVNLATGRWAITFVGADSRNTAVIYFCVLTTAQATAVAQPQATNTSVPPTAVPATATTAATATTEATATSGTTATVATTATSGTTATVETTVTAGTTATTSAATATTVATAPATAVAATATTQPTAEVPTAVVAPATAVVPVATMAPEVSATPAIPGMPTTGQSDMPMLITLALAAMGLLGLGLATRRMWGSNR